MLSDNTHNQCKCTAVSKQQKQIIITIKQEKQKTNLSSKSSWAAPIRKRTVILPPKRPTIYVLQLHKRILTYTHMYMCTNISVYTNMQHKHTYSYHILFTNFFYQFIFNSFCNDVATLLCAYVNNVNIHTHTSTCIYWRCRYSMMANCQMPSSSCTIQWQPMASYVYNLHPKGMFHTLYIHRMHLCYRWVERNAKSNGIYI